MRPTSLLLALASVSACAEPAIEMHLELPPEAKANLYNVSCVGAIEVTVRGNDRGSSDDDGRPADDIDGCVTVENVTSFDSIRAAIAGRFELDLPESGLAGVEIRGSTGTCNKDLLDGDAIFYGAAEYNGGDLFIPMTPNLSCGTTQPVVVRPVDLLALTTTGICPVALPDAARGEVASATIHGMLLKNPLLDYNNDWSRVIGGVASLPLYPTSDNESCVALEYYENAEIMTAASCVRRGTGVCSAAGQIELPIIDWGIAEASVDLALIEQYGGAAIGGVWGTDGAGNKIKLTGATITPAKASKAKIVYADYSASAARLTSLPAATATSASGLFIAYVGEPVDVVIRATGYRDETIRLASPNEPSTALIMMTKI